MIARFGSADAARAAAWSAASAGVDCANVGEGDAVTKTDAVMAEIKTSFMESPAVRVFGDAGRQPLQPVTLRCATGRKRAGIHMVPWNPKKSSHRRNARRSARDYGEAIKI
jgi:hypothetical protein